MAKATRKIDEKALSKGEVRKLTALRKSIGVDLADQAFAKWYAKEGKGEEPNDPNVGMIEKRSEEHTSELQSLMRISYAVFCLKKKQTNSTHNIKTTHKTNIT